jgi:hypothetical protein
LVDETLGSYKIVGRLGAGGMGEVYRATHLHIERDVAIKVLLPGLTRDPGAVARFMAEARATSLIRHPGIIEVLDCAVHADGRIYIVMELLSGENLGQMLNRQGSVANDLRGACALIAQIASAVAAAHERGVIHRDLKPDNVFLHRPASGDRVQVKVLDFGIAKLLSPKFLNTRQTKTGDILGTPLYMAPEQCRGHGGIDQRTDVYALGCIAYQLLAGRPPFLHEGAGDLLIAHVLEDPPDLASLAPGVPPALRRLVMHMLMKLPDDRPGTMAEVLRRIEEIAADVPERAAGQEDRSDVCAAAGGTRVLPRGPDFDFARNAAKRLRKRDRHPTRRWGQAVMALAAATTAAMVFVWFVRRQPPRVSPSAVPPVAKTTAPAAGAVAPRPMTPVVPQVREAAGDRAAATLTPTAVRDVKINVATRPSGAEVWVAGEAVPRGRTPIRVSFASRRQPRDLLLRARGYQDESLAVAGDRDSVVTVALQRSSSRRPALKPSASAATAQAAQTPPERPRGEVIRPANPARSPYWRMAD